MTKITVSNNVIVHDIFNDQRKLYEGNGIVLSHNTKDAYTKIPSAVVVPLQPHYYYWFMHYIAPFLWIKKNIDPDVRLYLYDAYVYPSSPHPRSENFVKQTTKELNDAYGGVISKDKNYLFEKIYVAIPELSPIALPGVEESVFDYYDPSNFLFLPSLKDAFAEYMVKDEKFPKKILSSRIGIESSMIEQINGKEELDWIEKHYVSDRLMGVDPIYDIEKKYLSEGCLQINFEDLDIRDQIKMFYNAEEVTGISGTNLINAIFSEARINIILARENFTFDFVKLFNAMNKNINIINLIE